MTGEWPPCSLFTTVACSARSLHRLCGRSAARSDLQVLRTRLKSGERAFSVAAAAPTRGRTCRFKYTVHPEDSNVHAQFMSYMRK